LRPPIHYWAVFIFALTPELDAAILDEIDEFGVGHLLARYAYVIGVELFTLTDI
jgi:hypothetical protein